MGNNKCKPDEKRVPKFKVGDFVQNKSHPDRYGTVKHCTVTMLHIALEGPFREAGSGVPDGKGGNCWTAEPDKWQLMKEKPQSRAAYARSVTPEPVAAAPVAVERATPVAVEPPKYNPEWSYGVAERLHDALVKAAEEYNAYIASKPTTFYIPVDTKFSRAD